MLTTSRFQGKPWTEKYRHRDRPPQHMKAPGRFTKGCRNCRFNLTHKNETLQLQEALET